MDGFKWLPSYETGDAEIDSDHRKLFALVETIREGLATLDARSTNAAVQEFIDAAAEHFAREEEILVRVSFPGLDDHRVYHTSLLAKAKQLGKICSTESDPKKASACYDKLIAFLVDDVVRGDSQFKSYLDHFRAAHKEK